MSPGSQLFATAFSLGVAYNAAPGAVNTEALRRGLSGGFRPALLVQLGALIGDSTWAALALTGTAFIVQNRSARLLLGAAGACFLLRLAWNAVRQAWSGGSARDGNGLPGTQGRTSRGDFATGAFFSLANPFALAFWTGIGGGLTASGGATPQAGSFVVLFTGFVLGALLWCLCIPVVIGWGRRFVRPAVFRWINTLCGLALGYFGVTLFLNTLHAVLDHPMAAASLCLDHHGQQD